MVEDQLCQFMGADLSVRRCDHPERQLCPACRDPLVTQETRSKALPNVGRAFLIPYQSMALFGLICSLSFLGTLPKGTPHTRYRMRQNTPLAKIRQGQPAVGLWLHSHSFHTARILAAQGFLDWILVDM